MSKHIHYNTTFSANFFKYINEIYADSSNPYSCSAISDIDFVKLGVLRCLSYAQTGQGFLQDHGNVFQKIDPSHFFKMLKSQRRLENTSSINELLRRTMKAEIADPFAQYNELKTSISMPQTATTIMPPPSILSPPSRTKRRFPQVTFSASIYAPITPDTSV